MSMKRPKEKTVCTTRMLLAVAAVSVLAAAFSSVVLAAPSSTTLSPRELMIFDPFALRTIIVAGEPSGGDVQATSVVLVSRPTIRTGYKLPMRSAFRPVW